MIKPSGVEREDKIIHDYDFQSSARFRSALNQRERFVCVSPHSCRVHFTASCSFPLERCEYLSASDRNSKLQCFCWKIVVSDELENDELRLIVLKLLLNGSPLTLEDEIESFRMKRHYGSDYSSGLEFVSSHFCDIRNQSKRNLEIEDFELILNSPSLAAENEDSLYEEISKHSAEDAGWFGLFKFIRFNFSLNGRDNILNTFQ
jgi:hypothetical protein